MAAPEWCVVAFDDGVQLVPKNWVNEGKCFWPNFKSTLRYEKAVKSCEQPEEAWSAFPARILGTYSSYEIAKPKLKLAEEQSDLSTDNEQSKKNRKFRRKRVISDSDEEVYEVEDSLHLQIKPFPIQPIDKDSYFARKKTKNLQQPSETQCHNNYELGSDDDDNSIPSTSARNSAIGTPTTSARNSPLGVTPYNKTTSRIGQPFDANEDFKQRVYHDLSFIKVNLLKLNQKLDLFVQRPLGEHVQKNGNEKLDKYEEITQNLFPLKTCEKLEEMELKLRNDPEFKTKLIHYCSCIGGYKVDEICKLILRKLLTDKLAALYSWLGAKKKNVFSHLYLAEVILKSVRANKAAVNATEKEIIDSIKNWLRHASTRDKNKEKIIKNAEIAEEKEDK